MFVHRREDRRGTNEAYYRHVVEEHTAQTFPEKASAASDAGSETSERSGPEFDPPPAQQQEGRKEV